MATPEQRFRQVPPPPSEDRRPTEWFWVGYGDTDQIGVVQSATGSYSQGSIAGSEIPAVGAPVQFSPGDPLGRIVVGSPQGATNQGTSNSYRDVVGLIGVQIKTTDPSSSSDARFIGDSWLNTTSGASFTWTGAAWVSVSSGGATITYYAGDPNEDAVTPITGRLYDTANGREFIPNSAGTAWLPTGNRTFFEDWYEPEAFYFGDTWVASNGYISNYDGESWYGQYICSTCADDPGDPGPPTPGSGGNP